MRRLAVACAAGAAACGGGFAIARAASSGNPPSPILIPRSVSFISAAVGWAWGPTSRESSRGELVRTVDGGRSWSVVQTQPLGYGPPDTKGISGVRFASRSRGYLFGGYPGILQTTDGGASWQQLRPPGPVLDLEVGGGEAYALVLDCIGCSTAHLFRVGRELVRIGPRTPVNVSWASLVVHGASVYLISPSGPGLGSTLWSSHDRGRAWRSERAPCVFPGGLGGAMAAWSATGLALACGGSPGAGSQGKSFYTSTDGGAHWRLTGRIGFGPGYVGGLGAADRKTWILAEADNPAILVTHDGGREWRAVPATGSGGEGWGYVGFIDSRDAVAVPWTLNGTALAITRDGGRTWNEARIAAPHPASAPPPPAPANPWRAYWTAVDPGSGIQFVSPQAGFALAGEPLNLLDRGLSAPIGPMVAWPSPAVLVSRDRGQSWQPSLPASTGFWGLAFADHAHGIAVGVTSLYRTDDGGGDWRQITEPDPSLVRVAYLQAPQTVAGLTTMGQLMASRDGGSSWHHAAWGLEGRAICSVGDAVLVADQGGGVWRSKDLGFPFNEAASRIATPLEDSPWWIDLSCAGHNAVEYMQAFPEAAGAGVQTIVRQSTDGGYRWRRIAQIAWGAARPGAPSPVQAVAVGRRKVCILSYANKPTLDIRCTSDGGRTFRQARTPPMPRSQYADLHLQGVTFLGPSHGWLLVVDSLVNGRQPPRYETQIWATADGGASWRVAYASPTARVPQLR